MKKQTSLFHLAAVVSLPFLLFGIVISFYCGCSALLHSTMFASSRPSVCKSEEQEQAAVYAKARANCVLYKTPATSDNSLSNLLFNVPESYFVRILEKTSDAAYKVIYSDRVGYVARDSVRRVSIEPEMLSPEPISLTTKSGSGTILRSEPSTNSASVALIPENSEIVYISSIFGEKPADGLSFEWFFVQFFPQTEPNIYYEGYVHSERTTTSPAYPTNAEDDPVVPLPLGPDISDTQESLQTPTWLRALLISVLTLPCLLFALYLIAAIIQKRKVAI